MNLGIGGSRVELVGIRSAGASLGTLSLRASISDDSQQVKWPEGG